jgi:hypothetical protein
VTAGRCLLEAAPSKLDRTKVFVTPCTCSQRSSSLPLRIGKLSPCVDRRWWDTIRIFLIYTSISHTTILSHQHSRTYDQLSTVYNRPPMANTSMTTTSKVPTTDKYVKIYKRQIRQKEIKTPPRERVTPRISSYSQCKLHTPTKINKELHSKIITKHQFPPHHG